MRPGFDVFKIIKLVLRLFSSVQRKKVVKYSVWQFLLSILDIAAIGLIGVLASLAISGINSKTPGNKVSTLLELLNIRNLSLQDQVALIAILATSILVSKTIISIKLSKSILEFIAQTNTAITERILTKLFLVDNFKRRDKSLQDSLYLTTQGVEVITIGVLGTLIVMVGDCGLLLLIFVTLLIVNFKIALLTLLGVATVSLIINRGMHKKTQELGLESSSLYIASAIKFEEFGSTYKEILIRNRRAFLISQLVDLRAQSGSVNARLMMLPNVSKYIIESSIVIGSLIIAGVQFVLSDAVHAIASLTIFMASGARIAPALLRVQQGTVQIRSKVASATETIEILQRFDNSVEATKKSGNTGFTREHKGFNPTVSFKNVSFRYPGTQSFEIRDFSFSANAGDMIAIVGRSGSGKSTLIDLLLGILEPESGTIEISGKSPLESFEEWPGAVGYVPQHIYLNGGSLTDNIKLGYEDQNIDEGVISEVIRLSDLEALYSENLPDNAKDIVSLSGGQKQRVGIARALLTNPRLLVLDEATSALDAITENSVTEVFQKFRGENTLIVVAHRLSTIRNADIVIYIDAGKISASGTFDQIRLEVEDFDAQAKLLGL